MDSSINAFQIFQQAVEKLTGKYEEGEAAANVRWLMEDLLGISRVDIAIQKRIDEAAPSFTTFEQALDRLQQGEPIQYVLGYAEFLNERYQVNPSVLIPRPETEELALKVIKENLAAKRILDIGTGTGCIAITLAKAIHGAKVLAWDIDEDTLAVARGNATTLQAKVDFKEVDALKPWSDVLAAGTKFDVIVSNPPYITENEKVDMKSNVIDHEPSKALFVPDNDPLLFYRVITDLARPFLNPGGKLYFEINERYGDDTVAMMRGFDYKNVSLFKDFHDKHRMVSACWDVSQT